MFPFRKKPKEEESRKDSPKPKKTRKKKEAPKPWGKKERFAVLVILILIPAFSLFFFIRSNPKTSLATNVNVLGETSSKPNINTLRSNLEKELKDIQGTYGIWFQTLDNTYSLGINDTTQFDGASLFKLPLMLAYFKEVDKGSIDPNATYTLKYSDQVSGAGILSTFSPGTVVTYHDMLEAMGKNSDNAAFQIITNMLTPAKTQAVINEIGMSQTDLTKDLTTPKDIGLLFYKVANTNIISTSSKQEFLKTLKNTDFESLIPQGIPENIEVAHKYGSLDDVLNDAGIIYAQRPYTLVILTKDTNPNEVQQKIVEISKLVYDWLIK